MKKTLKHFLVSYALLSGISAESKPYSVDLGVYGGVSLSRVSVDARHITTAALHSQKSLNTSGAEGGVFARFLYKNPKNFVFGFDGSIGGARDSAKHFDSVAGVQLRHRFQRSTAYQVGAIFGHDFENVIAYGKIGFANDHWKYQYSEDAVTEARKKNVQGLQVGLGLVVTKSPRFLWGLEVTHTFARRMVFDFPGAMDEKVRLKPFTTKIMCKLSYRFI